jgi:hypothetical protein
MKLVSIIILFCQLTALAVAQSSEITIRVIDSTTKKPIKNASVVILGTTDGTSTNYLGYCKLLVSAGRKVVVSHLSYETGSAEVPAGVTSFSIALKKGITKLSDIDLTQYPNKSKPTDFPLSNGVARNLPDSFQILEAYARFPYEGGAQIAFRELFGNAFQFPEEELRANKSGTIPFEFTIDISGNYVFPKCHTDSSSQVCGELKRILTILPKWKPAEQFGEPVPQTFLMNVHYGPSNHWKKKIKKDKPGN